MYSPDRVLVTHETRELIELFHISSGRMCCMCSEEMLSAPAASSLVLHCTCSAKFKKKVAQGHWPLLKNVCSENCRTTRHPIYKLQSNYKGYYKLQTETSVMNEILPRPHRHMGITIERTLQRCSLHMLSPWDSVHCTQNTM